LFESGKAGQGFGPVSHRSNRLVRLLYADLRFVADERGNMTINSFAGMGSHQSARSQTDSWVTPPAIIEALGGHESFDLDPCAAEGQVFRTAKTMLTVENNGLFCTWSGRVWLNPPYSVALLSRFMARMSEHGRGIALIFARTETETFHRYVWDRADAVMFLRGRLNFHRPDGSLARSRHGAPANAGAPSVLIAYGEEDLDILAAAPVDGRFVPLRLPSSVIVLALNQSWAEALSDFFADRNDPVALGDLYRAFSAHPKARKNIHYRDKLRQTLQRGRYERVAKGVWQKSAA
jgi:phage N-6-adenine-methyltransferase